MVTNLPGSRAASDPAPIQSNSTNHRYFRLSSGNLRTTPIRFACNRFDRNRTIQPGQSRQISGLRQLNAKCGVWVGGEVDFCRNVSMREIWRFGRFIFDFHTRQPGMPFGLGTCVVVSIGPEGLKGPFSQPCLVRTARCRLPGANRHRPCDCSARPLRLFADRIPCKR